jgi:hypothetical protein
MVSRSPAVLHLKVQIPCLSVAARCQQPGTSCVAVAKPRLSGNRVILQAEPVKRFFRDHSRIEPPKPPADRVPEMLTSRLEPGQL